MRFLLISKKCLLVHRFGKLCPAIFVCSFYLYILLKVTEIPKIRHENKEKFAVILDLYKQQYIKKVNNFCVATEFTKKIRESWGTAHINPARNLVEELLTFVTFPAKLCPVKGESGERVAVILVSSARSHFKERQLIRKTWGSIRKYKEWDIRTVFSLGQSEYCVTNPIVNHISNQTVVVESKVEDLLQEEFKRFGDLLIGSFTDTYKNLTYKQLMSYKFVLEYCPQADFIVKTDDDMFVNILRILDLRTKELESDQRASDLYCHVFYDKPTRCKNCLKWFVTREEWPEEDYPEYCLGGDFAISKEWMEKIYSVRHKGGFFWVDDVFVSGKLRKIAEETYNVTGIIRNLKKHVSDWRRPKRKSFRNFCNMEDAHFGLFMFLDRKWDEFEGNMECLWHWSVERMGFNKGNILLD